MKLFLLPISSAAQQIKEISFRKEKELQNLIEKHLPRLLDVDLVTNRVALHGGMEDGLDRSMIPDTLGITKDHRPAIIEYKKTTSAVVVTQLINYSKYLSKNREKFFFQLQQNNKLKGIKQSQIRWNRPRLVGIAPGFDRFEPGAAEEKKVELITYKFFDNHTILLDWGDGKKPPKDSEGREHGTASSTTDFPGGSIGKDLRKCSNDTQQLFFAVIESFAKLGKDMSHNYTSRYVPFKKNGRVIASIANISSRNDFIKVYLQVNPSTVNLREGFTRDMRKIKHNGIGSLEVTIKTNNDMRDALPLFRKAYEEN